MWICATAHILKMQLSRMEISQYGNRWLKIKVLQRPLFCSLPSKLVLFTQQASFDLFFCFLLELGWWALLDFTFNSTLLQLGQFLFIYVTYLLLRTFADGNCLYGDVSVRLEGNDSLIQLIRILISLELFLNHEFYHSHKKQK